METLTIKKCYFGKSIPASFVSHYIRPAKYIGQWVDNIVLMPVHNSIFVFYVGEDSDKLKLVDVVVSTDCVSILV